MPLSWSQTLAIFVYAMITCLVVNDAIKVVLIRWCIPGYQKAARKIGYELVSPRQPWLRMVPRVRWTPRAPPRTEFTHDRSQSRRHAALLDANAGRAVRGASTVAATD